MLALHKNLASAKTPPRQVSRQAGEGVRAEAGQSTDGAIDRLVHELSPEGDNIWVDGR